MATSTAPVPLSFPAQTFAKLSPHPYMLSTLNPPDNSRPSQRTNGRDPTEPRPFQVNMSSLTHTNGSAMVRLGDTSVVCGVRAETLPVAEIPSYRQHSLQGPKVDEIQAYDLLVPNIELATGCAPAFLPGVPPTTLAQTLSTRLYSLLLGSNMVQADDLRIWQTDELEGEDAVMKEPGAEEKEDDGVSDRRLLKAYWALFIDVTFISYDGNPFDAAWAAVLAALHNLRLPHAWFDIDREMIVCSRKDEDAKPLRLNGFPVSYCASIFTERDQAERNVGEHWLLVDPDRFEEKLCEESVSIVVDRSSGSTRILSLSKHGGCVVGRKHVQEFRGLAEKRWEEFRKAAAVSSS